MELKNPATILASTSLLVSGVSLTILFRQMSKLQDKVDQLEEHTANFGKAIGANGEDTSSLKDEVTRLRERTRIQDIQIAALTRYIKESGGQVNVDIDALMDTNSVGPNKSISVESAASDMDERVLRRLKAARVNA